MISHDAAMAGSGPADGRARVPLSSSPLVAGLERILAVLNFIIIRLSSLALLAAAFVLSESVVVRYFLKQTTDWQDETCVMLLVGATFLSTAHVQSLRGHVGIEALNDLLSPAVNHARRILVDVFSLLFCVFFAWKSWTLTHEAWVDGQVTASTFAPPLWIPYSTMSIGMSLLAAQILVQLLALLLNGQKK